MESNKYYAKIKANWSHYITEMKSYPVKSKKISLNFIYLFVICLLSKNATNNKTPIQVKRGIENLESRIKNLEKIESRKS